MVTVTCVASRSRRMRKHLTAPDVWVKHRKLCKKRASAKWYAKKKQREIKEQNDHRRALEHVLQQKSKEYLWSPLQRTHNRVFLASLHFGYPMWDGVTPIALWDYWKDTTEEALENLHTHFPERSIHPTVYDVSLRRLGMGCWKDTTGETPFHRFKDAYGLNGPWLVSPLGYVLVRLVEQHVPQQDWSRWIQASHRIYHCMTLHKDNSMTTGKSVTPHTNPTMNWIRDDTTDKEWHEWHDMIDEFNEWMETQPPSPTTELYHDSDNDKEESSDDDEDDIAIGWNARLQEILDTFDDRDSHSGDDADGAKQEDLPTQQQQRYCGGISTQSIPIPIHCQPTHEQYPDYSIDTFSDESSEHWDEE